MSKRKNFYISKNTKVFFSFLDSFISHSIVIAV